MTTMYAQQVHSDARFDVNVYGRITSSTEIALLHLGYAPDAIADLERRLLETKE